MASTHFDVPTPDGMADAYAAWPDEGDGFPGVLLYPDIFGLRPVITGMVDEIASHGYYVLAPNFFYRHGRSPAPEEAPDLTDPAQREAAFDRLLPLMRQHSAESAVRDAEGFLDFLLGQPEVADGPVGTTGYCFGGVLAFRTAAAEPDRVAAAASFHAGGLVTDDADSPHLLAGSVSAEVHFGHAAQDDSMTPQQVTALEEALEHAGATYTSEVYPDTLHGFAIADIPWFNSAARDRHWERLLFLLARALKG